MTDPRPQALGMDLVGDAPDGPVLEVLVVAKCLDADGDVELIHYASEGLSTWEALGMGVVLTDVLRAGLSDAREPGSGGDE